MRGISLPAAQLFEIAIENILRGVCGQFNKTVVLPHHENWSGCLIVLIADNRNTFLVIVWHDNMAPGLVYATHAIKNNTLVAWLLIIIGAKEPIFRIDIS